jgi:RimJ/RimL family protein N-acetyltransferase
MHATAIRTPSGVVTVRMLRAGDTETVQRVFDRLGPRSRLLRFGGAKNVLSAAELEQLARVDGSRHVLVAYADREPIGIARFVRDEDPTVAEVAFAVVDDWQGRGVGGILVDLLVADGRAIGVTRLRATMHTENKASLALMRRATRIESTRVRSGELEVVGLAA